MMHIMDNRFQYLPPVFLIILLVLPNWESIDAVMTSLEGYKAVLGGIAAGTLSGWYLGFGKFAIKRRGKEDSRVIFYDVTENMNGAFLRSLFNDLERRKNHPASAECLKRLKSYFVLTFLGTSLTLSSIGILVFYLLFEISYENQVLFGLTAVLIFIVEWQLTKAILSYHSGITKLTGGDGIGSRYVYPSSYRNVKHSIGDWVTAAGFLSVALFIITTVNTFSAYVTHPDIYYAIHYLIVFSTLTCTVGWVGIGFYRLSPSLFEKYRDTSEPSINKSILIERVDRPDNALQFKTMEQVEKEESA